MSKKNIGKLFGKIINDTQNDYANSKKEHERVTNDINQFKNNMRKRQEKFTLIRNK